MLPVCTTKLSWLIYIVCEGTFFFSTCRGSAQHHWLSSGDTEVPDPIAMAHILLEQLAQSPGAGGGFETGHDLKRVWGREKYNGLTALS